MIVEFFYVDIVIIGDKLIISEGTAIQVERD